MPDAFREFSTLVRNRLAQGREMYGDESFKRPPLELVGEIEQELLDVYAWSFILWSRLQRVTRKLDAPGSARGGSGVPHYRRSRGAAPRGAQDDPQQGRGRRLPTGGALLPKAGAWPRWKREAIVRWLESEETQALETSLLAQLGSNKTPWIPRRSLASCAERNETSMPNGDRAA
jgi:hypothetical protein